MTAPNQLGEFLRARRSRLRKADVGLPAGVGLRRTPGLRREEPAVVAGLSIDYHIRLEQGKETNPSGPSRDDDAMTLHSMIASGEQAPGRWPTPGRPPV